MSGNPRSTALQQSLITAATTLGQTAQLATLVPVSSTAETLAKNSLFSAWQTGLLQSSREAMAACVPLYAASNSINQGGAAHTAFTAQCTSLATVKTAWFSFIFFVFNFLYGITLNIFWFRLRQYCWQLWRHASRVLMENQPLHVHG